MICHSEFISKSRCSLYNYYEKLSLTQFDEILIFEYVKSSAVEIHLKF